MKLLIAFALFAVAFAEEIRVVPLPQSPLFSMPSMGQVIIPNYVIDAIKPDMPIMRDEAVAADDAGLKVNFVDAPLEDVAPEAVNVVDAPEPVILGEAPLPAFETVFYAVEFVDVAPVAVEFVPEAVEIPEARLPFFEAPEDHAVNFVDGPLDFAVPEPVMLPEAALPAFESAPAVEAVKIAEPQFNDYRGKQFEDPMLRVNFVDTPLDVAPVAEEIIPEPVSFVDAPAAEELAVESVRIAEPSLPEVAPVAEEIVPEPVSFVDAPVAEELAVEAVRIAEPILPEVAPVAEEIVPEPVNFVDAPLDFAVPEPVMLPEAALPAFESAPAVEAVKIAEPQFNDYRGKQFNDPRLR